MGRFILLCLLTCVFVYGVRVSPAQAQTIINQANQQGEDIQRQQQVRQREDMERALENRRPPTSIEAPMPAAPQGTGTGCINIKTVTITGAKSMDTSARKRLEREYAGRCLGVNEIQQLLSEITRIYIEKGYATTRAYLPEQDMSQGTLQIDVIEGRIEKLQLNEGDKKGSLYIPNAFPGLEGDVLNLRDIEQGLDQVNRLASNNATMDIAPGSAEGLSIITINNQPSKRWHVNLTADNYGARTTGVRQLGATISADSLLGFNEFYSITRRATVPFGNYEKQSSSTSALFSIPFGYATFTTGYNRGDYDSTLVTPSQVSLHLNGDSQSAFGTLDLVAYRSQSSKVTLSSTLTVKESRNYIAGTLLGVSSRRLAVLDVGANVSTEVLSGLGSAGITYSRGLSALGALEDPAGLSKDLPHAQFDKVSLNASWFKGFSIAGQNLSWSTQLTAQKAFDTLHGSEQISVGGLYSVRGFHEEQLANDHGYFVRNDLTLSKNLGTIKGMDISFRPYVALDAGAVTGRADGTDHGTLVGVAGGFKLGLGSNALFEVMTGRPIKTHDTFGDKTMHTYGRFSISF